MFLGAGNSQGQFISESGIKQAAGMTMDIYIAAAKYGIQDNDVDYLANWPYGTTRQWTQQNGVPDLSGQAFEYGGGSGGGDVYQIVRQTALDNGWVNDALEPISPTDLSALRNFAGQMGVDLETAMGWPTGTIQGYMTGAYPFPAQQETIAQQIAIQEIARQQGWVDSSGRLVSPQAARNLISYGATVGLGPTEIDQAFGWSAGTVLAYSRLSDNYVVSPEVFDPVVVAPPITQSNQPTSIVNAPSSSGPASNAGTVSYGVDSSGFLVSLPPGSVVAVPGSTQQPAQPGVMTMVNANGPTVNAQGAPVAPTRQAAGGSLLLAVLAALSFLN